MKQKFNGKNTETEMHRIPCYRLIKTYEEGDGIREFFLFPLRFDKETARADLKETLEKEPIFETNGILYESPDHIESEFSDFNGFVDLKIREEELSLSRKELKSILSCFDPDYLNELMNEDSSENKQETIRNREDKLELSFVYNEYAAGGIFLECYATDYEPYATISIWTDISPLLKYTNEIVIPAYKISKDILDLIESYGFMKVDYERPVTIGHGTGYIASLTDDYKQKIDKINQEKQKKMEVGA